VLKILFSRFSQFFTRFSQFFPDLTIKNFSGGVLKPPFHPPPLRYAPVMLQKMFFSIKKNSTNFYEFSSARHIHAIGSFITELVNYCTGKLQVYKLFLCVKAYQELLFGEVHETFLNDTM